MSISNNTIGFYIPNSDYKFHVKKVKSIEDHVFVITIHNEIIVFRKKEDKINQLMDLSKRFLLFTHPQNRTDIFDILTIKANTGLLDPIKCLIVSISSNLNIHFWNLKDGLCISKVNLSNYKRKGENLVEVFTINERFILFIFSQKCLLFDTSTLIIINEEKFSFVLKSIYRMKMNKFFLLTEAGETYIIEIENVGYIYSSSVEKEFNYEEIRCRLIKHTFHILKVFGEDTMYTLSNNHDFVYHNLNQSLKVSFLDSVEELSELSSFNTEYKFKIIFLDKITIDEEELMIIIYKDLTCEIFLYDRKVREIKRRKRFMIMIEDEFLIMKYAIMDSVLIGYVDSYIHLFDLRKFINPDEKYVDRTLELANIFGKKSKKLFFTNFFMENFSSQYKHYIDSISSREFKVVKDYIKEESGNNNEHIFVNELNNTKKSKEPKSTSFNVTASTILANSENYSIYNVIGTDSGKVALIDIFFNENMNLTPIILIDYHSALINSLRIYENKYLIISSVDGVITFTDISKEKLELALNKVEAKENNINNFDFNAVKDIGENSTNLNYYYSKRKSLTLRDVESMMVVKDKKNGKMDPRSRKIINLLPIHTCKNYHKLNRIMPVTQLDNAQISMMDENFKKYQNNLLAFELQDNSLMVICMETLKTIYTFNSTKHSVKAIYHLSYEKCLIVYLANNTIRVCNYVTKTADRIVTDINKINNILRVDEKLKLYFVDPGKIILDYFKINYEFSNIKKNDKQNSNSNGIVDSMANLLNNYNQENSSNYLKYSKKQNENLITGVSMEYIREYLSNENLKKLFFEKYIHNAFNKKKINLNTTLNKFESGWMKKIEPLIIDEIFMILNSFELDENLKKISIMNLLYNPSTHYTISYNKYDYNNNQVLEGNILKIGNQLNEYISLNYEDYFLYIEKMVHEQKISKNYYKNRINFYNIISLFHIWNLSIDQDINFLNYLKIYQPIFEFNFILNGVDSSLSLILNEEEEIDGYLAGYHEFFMDYIKQNEEGKKLMKGEKYCNKSYIIKSQQGYLPNLKNYQFSSNLSHFMNLAFFGSLVAVLGFEESNEICRLMTSEKMILRNLAQLKYIVFTNLISIDKFMYEFNDDIALSNKDIILVDYLSIKYNKKITSGTIIDYNKVKTTFFDKFDRILGYLESLYSYIFNLDSKEVLFANFYKLHKEKNIESANKMNFLTEFELSLINLVINFNSITNEKDKLDDIHMIKVTELLILFVFKILNPNYSSTRNTFSKTIVELLTKSTDYQEKIYKENMTNYAKFLIDLYSSFKIPIDLDGLFKKYEIGNCMIIKSEENFNFIKIMLAKLIKNFSKTTNLSYILKIVVEEFKKKTTEYDYFSYLLEILWIVFREKNSKHINYLPPLINLIMTTMSPTQKEMRNSCLDNAKKVLSCLLPNYPMIGFHQNSQKLAVGANDGKVYIYDLTSGNIWKNLNAHTNEITAISFDFTGNILISYSSTEKTVKFWKIGLTNFFSNFFSMKDGYYKSLKFNAIKEDPSSDDKVNIVKFQLMPKNDNKVVLIREDKSVEVLDL